MKSKFILGLGISLGVLSACEKNDNFDVKFDAVGDIYVRCQKIDNEIKYAPVYIAYSNIYMSEAEVAFSDHKSPVITLIKVGENAVRFTSTPAVDDYSTNDINNGDYEFNLVSTESDSLKVTDKLLEERIDPIEITKFDYDAEKHEIDIAWNMVENRDIYHITIATEIDGRTVFSSERLNENKLILKETSLGWDSNYTMKAGTTYTVSVSAYKFENSNQQSGYHINQESVEYREIEW
ncbi:hypothetical protein [Ancylomarina sp.]|uniref:hypothetical protein n=1 Tax=Ancylomarina sp. TaxID=1970196 RepID=UPI003562CA83